MAASTESNQRVTNAKILSKLETMDTRLEDVERTSRITAEHSIRYAEKWDQYSKDQNRVFIRLDKLENNRNEGDKKNLVINGGLIAAVIGLIEVIKAVML